MPARPTQISATVDWRNQSSGTFTLPAFTLSPGEVRTLSLADYQQAGQIPPDAAWGTVKLAYMGRSADLVAVCRQLRQGQPLRAADAVLGGSQPAVGRWHVARRCHAQHVHHHRKRRLGSHHARGHSLLQWWKEQVQDGKDAIAWPAIVARCRAGHSRSSPGLRCHTLPPATMTGSYELRDLDHATVGQLYEASWSSIRRMAMQPTGADRAADTMLLY